MNGSEHFLNADVLLENFKALFEKNLRAAQAIHCVFIGVTWNAIWVCFLLCLEQFVVLFEKPKFDVSEKVEEIKLPSCIFFWNQVTKSLNFFLNKGRNSFYRRPLQVIRYIQWQVPNYFRVSMIFCHIRAFLLIVVFLEIILNIED